MSEMTTFVSDLETFAEFPKIARLSRECVITEKIDGTNAQVVVIDDGRVLAGSRNRFITPEADNFGFARWVKANEDELRGLGPGRHFGEWWGSGVQRGYGLTGGDKRFSLFNTNRWGDHRDIVKYPGGHPPCCSVVPVIYSGLFTTEAVEAALVTLREKGSLAAPGFTRPEGVVIFHTAGSYLFKKTLEKDEAPKGQR
jgi:RNA ligase-like protein